MNEKDELTKILQQYSVDIRSLYKKITQIEKSSQNRVKRHEVRARIKDVIEEVISNDNP